MTAGLLELGELAAQSGLPLVQGFVVTMRDFPQGDESDEQLPQRDNLDELPARLNRRSARHKFRY